MIPYLPKIFYKDSLWGILAIMCITLWVGVPIINSVAFNAPKDPNWMLLPTIATMFVLMFVAMGAWVDHVKEVKPGEWR